MATATQSAAPPEDRFVLDDANWQTYELLLAQRGPRRYRITYDRGRLELMTLSSQHGRLDGIFCRFLSILSDELCVPISDFGPMTLRREELDRGLEPDRCFYIQNELVVRGRDDIDLELDPPPDLALEIDISRNS